VLALTFDYFGTGGAYTELGKNLTRRTACGRPATRPAPCTGVASVRACFGLTVLQRAGFSAVRGIEGSLDGVQVSFYNRRIITYLYLFTTDGTGASKIGLD
jgi:hypothetical protein